MNFSVLISIYYKENPLFLDQALKSIEEQTVSPSEIVLVKDGPLTTELDDVIRQHQTHTAIPYKIVSLKNNVGLGDALAKGIKESSYPWIARMDSDDISDPKRFEKQIHFLKNHPEIDVLGTWISEFDQSIDKPIAQRKPPVSHENILKYAKYASPINHMSVLYKKEAVLNAGNYQSKNRMEDYHLWIRMLKQGAKFANLNEILIYARTGEEMIKRRKGINYFLNEIYLGQFAYEIGFFSRGDRLRNFFIRALPRLLPLFLLKILYSIARKSTKLS